MFFLTVQPNPEGDGRWPGVQGWEERRIPMAVLFLAGMHLDSPRANTTQSQLLGSGGTFPTSAESQGAVNVRT